MASRRMLTKKVTDDDNFMSLSSSAQALYLHLSMSADDDGFCNQVAISMFKAHASVQDLQALLEKRYIYQFENGVIVIKHWRMANALRKDRYTPTAFQEELKQLKLKDNGSYTLENEKNKNWLPDGCQEVAVCLPQDRIDKNSIDKINNLSSTYVDDCPTFQVEQSTKYVFQQYVDMWNTLSEYGISKSQKIPFDDKTRLPLLRKRLKDYGEDSFAEIIEQIKNSDFLQGKISTPGRKPFTLTFGWAIRPENYKNILEGKYRNKSITPTNNQKDENQGIYNPRTGQTRIGQ